MITGNQKSRWKSVEFCVYYVILVISFSYMYGTGISMSDKLNNYSSTKLESGWIPGRKIDMEDSQWR